VENPRARASFQERSQEENDIVQSFRVGVCLQFQGKIIAVGAQSERRGDARPIHVSLRQRVLAATRFSHESTFDQGDPFANTGSLMPSIVAFSAVFRIGLRYDGDISSGAQTERRGDAGPSRFCLPAKRTGPLCVRQPFYCFDPLTESREKPAYCTVSVEAM
jgi:hypothetical protein